MPDHDVLAERFEANRGHLRAVAYRMLGSASEADDAVQEAWLRLTRANADGIDNLGGWLTTVVSRVSLDMLRARSSRREEPIEEQDPQPLASRSSGPDPEQAAVLADSVGAALLVVLDTLSPAERLAFVLHDMFGVPFDEIAPIVGRTPEAARQLASRARRRVRGASEASESELAARREVVDAFLSAARDADFASLVALLDPDAVVRGDQAAVAMGGEWEAVGATAVAKSFSGRARAARPALIDGVPGAVWAPGGKPRVVIDFTIVDGKVAAIDLIADPAMLAELEIAMASA
jgi:RNA polymerase sigma-70 factor (ECF subfamily)